MTRTIALSAADVESGNYRNRIPSFDLPGSTFAQPQQPQQAQQNTYHPAPGHPAAAPPQQASAAPQQPAASPAALQEIYDALAQITAGLREDREQINETSAFARALFMRIESLAEYVRNSVEQDPAEFKDALADIQDELFPKPKEPAAPASMDEVQAMIMQHAANTDAQIGRLTGLVQTTLMAIMHQQYPQEAGPAEAPQMQQDEVTAAATEATHAGEEAEAPAPAVDMPAEAESLPESAIPRNAGHRAKKSGKN